MLEKDFFDTISNHYKNNLPFVMYRKPHKTGIDALLQTNNSLHITSGFTEQGFVFSPFDAINETVIIPTDQSEQIFLNTLEDNKEDGFSNVVSSQLKKNQNTTAKTQHIHLVNKGVQAIKENVFKKVVLSRSETLSIKNNDPIHLFKQLLNSYKSAFVYCWYHPKVGLWLGATPETLIKIEGQRFSIMALAGTQSYNGTMDVVWQEKEKQEQQFVTDFIVNNIKPFVSNIKTSDVNTVKAGNLLHLKTMISAQLNPDIISLKTLIEVLHPTPAVCGLPKQAAKHFILENENYDRAFYSGFLGELNYQKHIAPRTGRRNIENRAYAVKRNSTQLYVNLRCMQLVNNEAVIYVGGGITKTSHAESEWHETVSKSLVIKSVLD